jgi:hypothetical protein
MPRANKVGHQELLVGLHLSTKSGSNPGQVAIREADFAEVAENGARTQVRFTEGVDVNGVIERRKARLGNRRGCGGALIKRDPQACSGFSALQVRYDVIRDSSR